MVSETVGSTCSCCNLVAGPSQAAIDRGCDWACWALLPSRGQKRCFATVRGFIGDLVHVFPICSTSCFLLYQQNHPEHQMCGVLASRAAVLQLRISPPLRSTWSQHRVRGPGSRTGVGGESERGKNKSSRDTGPGIPDTQNPPRRDEFPFSQSQAGSRTLEERREQGRSSRLPGSPEVPRLQKDVARCFNFSFFLLGVLEATCKQLYSPTHPR